MGPISSRTQQNQYMHSTPVASTWGIYMCSPSGSHQHSTSHTSLLLHQHDSKTTCASSLFRHFHIPALRRRRRHSGSFALPIQEYGPSLSTPSAVESPLLGHHDYCFSRSRSRSRSNPLSQPRSGHSVILSPRTDSLNLESKRKIVQDNRRIRFIIPAILHVYLSSPPFRIMISRPPLPDLVDYYCPYLSHPATRPAVSFLFITAPYLPWSIRLEARPISALPSSRYYNTAPLYISVLDVLNGIYAALRKRVTLEEFESLAFDPEFRGEVIAAYRKRKTRETRGIPGVQEPMRRVDWLPGRTVFEGLEKSDEGEGVWKLKLGWNDTT